MAVSPGELARPLRIAVVAPLVTTISEPQQGGSQVIVADLAVGLTRRGHDVDVYAATGSLISGSTRHRDGDRLGEVCRPRSSGPASRDAPCAPSTRRTSTSSGWSARGGYDVVHSHGFDPPALRRARAGARRVIHTVHLPPEPEAAEALREAQGASEPASSSACPSRRRGRGARSSRSTASSATACRSSLIPWSDQPGDGLVFAGRLSAEKGAAVAIEIARLAGERIDLYGAAYDEDYARDLRRRHEGDPGVTFHEPLPRAELWRRLASARAVLCPSDWDEPFGLVAAEAQAAGTPVVAFARGGLTEIIDDAVTGFLVEPGNVAGAVAAVRSVASWTGDAAGSTRSTISTSKRASPGTRPSTLRSRGPVRRPAVSRATDRRTSGGPSEASRRPRSSDPRDPVGRAGRPDPAGHRGRGVESDGARHRGSGSVTSSRPAPRLPRWRPASSAGSIG